MNMEPTASSTVGPFLHLGLTEKHSITQLAAPEYQGERISLRFRLFDAEGLPVNDAMIEVWQADSQGRYAHPDDPRGGETEQGFRGFGRAATDESGSCEFETVLPGRTPGPEGKLQSPHVNVAIYARGILQQLYTRAYFAKNAANAEDPVLREVPEARRGTLMAQATGPHEWLFEIRLRGENETVFFDV